MDIRSDRFTGGAVLGRATTAVAPVVRTIDALADILVDEGVDVVFGLPGGAIAPLHNALLDRPQIRAITARHENGAIFAAAGYARTTGKLGVVAVTSGPGFTNTLTGLASAHCDGLPVLVLVGEVARGNFGKGALQDGSAGGIDVVAMTRSVSKASAQVNEPSGAPALLRRMIATAMSGRRGPVVLTLPVDVSNAMIQAPDISVDVATTFSIRPAVLEKAAAALTAGRRSVIFAGSGVREGQGARLLREFAERTQMPVMTTPKGKGVFPEDHPLSLGIFGLGGHPSASEFLREGIDVLLAVGTSLGELTTNGWSPLLRPRHTLIHVDIESAHLGRSYPTAIGITAPAELFFTRMIDVLPRRSKAPGAGVRYYLPQVVPTDGAGGIAPHVAIGEIQRSLPAFTLFTCDSGQHFLFAVHYLCTRRPDCFIVMSGYGSMGSGIYAAIGAQVAHPFRPVVAICGDGGFQMVATEVATAVAERLPVIFMVLNDERLGMVELGNESIFRRTPKYPTGPTRIADLARDLGAQAMVIDRPGQI